MHHFWVIPVWQASKVSAGDVMKNADYIIDIGPDGGSSGGEIVFQGTVKDMVEYSTTITAKYIRKSMSNIG
jgi:excinuclease UvrABC ATPase subunit